MEKEKILVITVPSLLLNKLDREFLEKTKPINNKHIKAKESILAFASLLCTKGYSNWLDGKHPRVSLQNTTLRQTLSWHYKRVIEFLEQEDVIEVDQSYQAGQFCKHYWLNEEYLEGGMVKYEVTDRFVRRRIEKMLKNRIIDNDRT